MESMFHLLQLLAIFSSLKIIKSQCTDEDSCNCHCQFPCSRTCSSCAMGWSGTTSNYCQRKNIAYGISAISTSTETYQEIERPANNAVDEDSDTYALTKSETNPQLTVTLADTYKIGHIYISLTIEATSPYYVYVTNSTSLSLSDDMLCTVFYRTTRNRYNVKLKCNNNGILTGNQVVIMRDTYNGRLQVFEIKVYQCSLGTYGSLCENECRNCQGNRCDGNTGICQSSCSHGWYGEKCDRKCSSNCETSFCDSVLGCTYCLSGHRGPDCELCERNTFGKNCSLTCKNCQDCDPVLGCKECISGFHGLDCNLSCPQGCRNQKCDRISEHCRNGCNDGFWGETCETSCKDTCGGNKTCYRDNGHCFECSPGKLGPYCLESCDFRAGSCNGQIFEALLKRKLEHFQMIRYYFIYNKSFNLQLIVFDASDF
ncbi:uncharacterized protein LOC128168312 [Crassostrea angulata]|uniref:uncharacterized protein LOC128168312 n=1 Tax=Magallana angulata TaxID=2784310 RepID=UPI0022B0BCCC|nr:uncharacterized protein LOC128168312 [Crassostrea angulata]